jgi:hypothetical protein
MRRNKAKAVGAVAATLAVGMMGTTVLADLPNDQTVTYNIRQDPTDETSPIIFTVDLDIMAGDADGDTVSWLIKQVVLTEIDHSESPPLTRVWTEDEPYVDTPDGYWTIEHDDVENITAEDFDEVPYIAGKAQPDDPRDPETNYDFEGAELVGSGPFSASFVVVTMYVILSQAPQPLVEIDDEPVEVFAEAVANGPS